MKVSFEEPQIAMIIDSNGVKGFVVLGETLEIKQKALDCRN